MLLITHITSTDSQRALSLIRIEKISDWISSCETEYYCSTRAVWSCSTLVGSNKWSPLMFYRIHVKRTCWPIQYGNPYILKVTGDNSCITTKLSPINKANGPTASRRTYSMYLRTKIHSVRQSVRNEHGRWLNPIPQLSFKRMWLIKGKWNKAFSMSPPHMIPINWLPQTKPASSIKKTAPHCSSIQIWFTKLPFYSMPRQ